MAASRASSSTGSSWSSSPVRAALGVACATLAAYYALWPSSRRSEPLPLTARAGRKAAVALHGLGRDARWLREELARSGVTKALEDAGVDLVYVDAPFTLVPGVAPARKWYSATSASKADGLEDSVREVQRAVAASQAVGIVGFSQGGSVAAVVAERAALKGKPFQWALFLASGFCPDEAKRPTTLAEDGPRSLHVMGDADPYKAEGEVTLSFFRGRRDAEVYRHPAGHVVPKNDETFLAAVRRLVA